MCAVYGFGYFKNAFKPIKNKQIQKHKKERGRAHLYGNYFTGP
jgi:hypothetical protein